MSSAFDRTVAEAAVGVPAFAASGDDDTPREGRAGPADASARDAARAGGAPQPLAELPLFVDARIVALVAPSEEHDPEILMRLGEIGFLPGEPVRVLARGVLGDPLAIRVGTGTFALRRSEARCIQVVVETASAGGRSRA